MPIVTGAVTAGGDEVAMIEIFLVNVRRAVLGMQLERLLTKTVDVPATSET